MTTLPPRQAQVLKFIIQYRRKNDVSPSYAEIADGNDMPLSQVQQVLNALAAKGVITKTEEARSIEVV